MLQIGGSDFRQDRKKSDVMYVRGDLGSEGFGNPNPIFWVLERIFLQKEIRYKEKIIILFTYCLLIL